MKRWLRRLLALLLLLIWFLVMLFPVIAVVLATQKQIAVGQEDGRQVRLFLLQEPAQEGVGVEWTRPTSAPQGEVGHCLQTNLVYLMWVGDAENVTYCRCLDEQGAVLGTEVGTCPNP